MMHTEYDKFFADYCYCGNLPGPGGGLIPGGGCCDDALRETKEKRSKNQILRRYNSRAYFRGAKLSGWH